MKYEPGKVGFKCEDNGQMYNFETSDMATKISMKVEYPLSSITADSQSTYLITVSLIDDRNRLDTFASNLVSFTVEGLSMRIRETRRNG